MPRSLFVVPLAVMVCLSGCKVSNRPATLMTLSSSSEGKQRLRSAPFDGEYRLYAAAAPRRGERLRATGEPLATQRLARHDRIGFGVTAASGERSAVAGERSVALPPGQYLWQMRPDAGQVDRGKTAVLLILIGAGIGIGLSAAASAPSIAWVL